MVDKSFHPAKKICHIVLHFGFKLAPLKETLLLEFIYLQKLMEHVHDKKTVERLLMMVNNELVPSMGIGSYG